ncbi:phytoene desaturase family protein [Alterisphingorhabdus coralli]|uniref:NAD(P)/FAD-dependent oxidoreductase n=1 Tax=Alterisphingorhabdus coralli TaxID=3071408 RepID=A0AA97F6L3_9SPHN|nr:NAD(P)/FAD-dependent oxidoreductase [Parasphingorhabdus sp. SCSIO 66989]WOE74406.1 NAD(P)/FAD-dependent oxidoreductase [Parasphingorhabdus sp. SCSIO 66989]
MSERKNWDAITIGSGLGSLSAAAALANQGKQVLVLERLANFGGAATVYRHGNLTMEASLHETDGDTVFNPDGVFQRLGLSDTVDPIETDIFYEVRGGPLAEPIRVPHGLTKAALALQTALPDDAPALESYFDELRQLYLGTSELEAMGSRGPSVLLSLLFSGQLFAMIGNVRRTISDRFDAMFHSSEAPKFALGAVLPYFDNDPEVMSYFAYAAIYARYVETGSYSFRGGSQALTRALMKRIRAAEGEARHNVTVKNILLDSDGAACGVAYENSNGDMFEVHAPIIFGGTAPQTLAAMLPEEQSADFAERYAKNEPSISLFSLSLGLNRPAEDFGVSAYSTFIYPERMTRYCDYAEAAKAFAGDPEAVPPYIVADYGRLNTGLAKPGDLHHVTLAGVDKLEWWADLDEASEMARRKNWIDFLITDLNRHYPGIADAIAHSEIATARTMHNRLGTPGGEVYGFRPTVSRLFGSRPNAQTAIKGLWLSSAYTVSGGYSGAMHGGLMAADAALRAERKD